MKVLGYDGVNNGNEEYIAFNPNQIKLIDNASPTNKSDIRYSKNTNVDEFDYANYNEIKLDKKEYAIVSSAVITKFTNKYSDELRSIIMAIIYTVLFIIKTALNFMSDTILISI